MNKIIYNDRTFFGRDVRAGNCFIGSSLDGEELAIDTLDVTVRSYDRRFFPLADSTAALLLDSGGSLVYARPRLDDLAQYTYGDPVYYYKGAELMGKFFMASVKHIGQYDYQLYCISAVGVLDGTDHYGGLYFGARFADVVADIIGGAVDCTIDAALQDIPLYGWLPINKRRANLHQALFAIGAALRKSPDGNLWVTTLSAARKVAISDDRLFQDGTIDHTTPATAAVVSEHAYIRFDSDEVVTLYSGEVAAESIVTPKGVRVQGVLVPFDAPIHDLRAHNAELLESGVNYAVLGQSSDCLLTGQKYTHVTREIVHTGATGGKDNTKSVKEATLVSLANSENVAERVFAYHNSTKLISNDIVVGSERPGDAVQLRDPFGELTDAIIKSMDINISGLLRASAVFAQGYIPTGIGNYYTRVVVLTADTLWSVPDECKGKLRAVVIGGGDGAEMGVDGNDGGNGSASSGGKGGLGGAGGTAGLGGRVFVTTLPVSSGQTFRVKIGVGGRGQTTETEAMQGGATVFGTVTSADGRPSDAGYSNLFGGELYALPGTPGQAGGKGAGEGEENEDVVYKGIAYHAGSNGERVVHSGIYAQGGFGGGAAAGASGANGLNGGIGYNPDRTSIATGGRGGTGAVGATGDSAVTLGSGGSGGHGGGGGGGAGGAAGATYNWTSDRGAGGAGGHGGDGANGCVIVYF